MISLGEALRGVPDKDFWGVDGNPHYNGIFVALLRERYGGDGSTRAVPLDHFLDGSLFNLSTFQRQVATEAARRRRLRADDLHPLSANVAVAAMKDAEPTQGDSEPEPSDLSESHDDNNCASGYNHTDSRDHSPDIEPLPEEKVLLPTSKLVDAPGAGSELVSAAVGTPDELPAGAQITIALAAGPERVSAETEVRPRASRQYRPAARAPAPPRGTVPEREAHDRAARIEIRLMFEKAGFCRVSLLPRRAKEMPIEFAVSGSGDPPELLALQEDWYQDVSVQDLGPLLREGIEWTGLLSDGRQVRLSLSGREIYVLARHSELNGFVSTPRLVLGEDHVVLCVAERLNDVMDAITQTGSPSPTLSNADSGVPAGWAGLAGVVPNKPIAPSLAGDILDVLRPLAEIKIALEGGIRIERQTWLSGFPPRIRIRGDTSTIGAVTIDGYDATLSPEGDYVVPGWDSLGDHSVWCSSASRTYAICSGAEDWKPWDAYTWSLGEVGVGGTQSHPAICGVLVRPPQVARSNGHAIVVPASNPVLIGAGTGEIEICKPRSDLRSGLCVGFPWFDPIWAIPADALRADKRSARVLLIGSSQMPADNYRRPSRRPSEGWSRYRGLRSTEYYSWCEAILSAARKGLQTEPSRPDIAALWKAYRCRAKALRRSAR